MPEEHLKPFPGASAQLGDDKAERIREAVAAKKARAQIGEAGDESLKVEAVVVLRESPSHVGLMQTN